MLSKHLCKNIGTGVGMQQLFGYCLVWTVSK